MSIAERHVVITGGGTGVGAEMAARFSAHGSKVTILGRRIEPLENVAAGTGALAITCDVTDRRAMDKALAQAVETYGQVDVAVANAGAATSRPFLNTPASDVEASFSVNVMGAFNLWQATAPDMKKRGWGRLISIASTAGLKGYPYVAGYCAAKHAVVGLTRALAAEFARTGITVNAICPGFIETPLLERSIENIVKKTGMTPDEAARTLRKGNPQGRFIQVDEVAEMALWLCSDGARSVHGQALSVSGGET